MFNAGPDSQSGGTFFAVADTFTGAPAGELVAPATVSLAGPLLRATDSTISAAFDLLEVRRSSLSSSSLDPLIQLVGTTGTGSGLARVTLGGARTDPLSPGTPALGRLLDITGSAATPASLTLAGPLLDATRASITTSDDVLGIFDGASVVSSSPNPFVSLTDSSLTAAGPGNVLVLASDLGLPPSLTLAGSLLAARNATLVNGDPSANVFSFAFVGDGADLVTLGSAPLLAFDNVTLDTAGAVLSLSRSQPGNPSSVSLGGPLLVAQNSSFNTTSLGFEATFGTSSTCCPGFFIGQGARLESSTPAPLIQLTSSVFNAGPDSQSGGTFFTVADTFTGAPAGELVAPATVSLAGPLLRATDSTISAAFDLLEVRRSSLSSSSPDPLIQLVGTTGTGSGMTTVTLGGTRTDPISPGTTSFGTLLDVVSGPASGTPAPAAGVSLAGPLLSAVNTAITTTGDVVRVLNGATLSSTTTAPLVQFTASVLNAGTTAFTADLFEISGTGGPTGTGFATVSLQGPLLSAGSTLNLTGGLAGIFGGGTLVATPSSTDPLASILGGTHAIATNPGTAMFRLFGRSGVTAAETISLPELETSVVLDLGTDRPVQGPGATPFGRTLLETSGASTSTQSVLRLDTALLEATPPALRLRSGSTLTSATDAFDLSFKAKVASLGPLVTLDASTLNVTNGALIRLANGSFLSVTGDLLSLANGSRLNLANGPVLNVTGNSVARITGAFASFVGTGNQINITNTACSGGAECLNFGPVRVALTGGAQAGNVSLGGSLVKGAGGAINYSSPSAAAIVVSGSGSRVVIQGQ